MQQLLQHLLHHAPWYLPILIYIVIAYVGVRWLGKHLANQPDQIKRLTINFAFCTLAAALFAVVAGGFHFDARAIAVILVGIVNAFANIAQWRANRVSMSKTSLLSFGDDIIATFIAMTPIIGDSQYVNTTTGVGIVLCIATGILFWWHSFRGGESSTFYKNVLIYSVCWGIADASQRYFALQAMPAGEFLLSWYGGSFLTLGCVFLVRSLRGQFIASTERVTLGLRDIKWIAVFACGIVLCLAIEYWAKMLAPQTTVGPLLLVAEAIVPTAVGLIVFKEGETFDRYQKGFAILGIVAVITLACGQHFN